MEYSNPPPPCLKGVTARRAQKTLRTCGCAIQETLGKADADKRVAKEDFNPRFTVRMTGGKNVPVKKTLCGAMVIGQRGGGRNLKDKGVGVK